MPAIASSTQTVQDVPAYELVSAPATLVPTPTPRGDVMLTVDVVVAYDLNANREVDPNEGVRNLSIRAVDGVSNALLASAATDRSGFVRMQLLAADDVLLVMPLLGETLALRYRDGDVSTSWTVLIDPANVPGLIP